MAKEIFNKGFAIIVIAHQAKSSQNKYLNKKLSLPPQKKASQRVNIQDMYQGNLINKIPLCAVLR